MAPAHAWCRAGPARTGCNPTEHRSGPTIARDCQSNGGPRAGIAPAWPPHPRPTRIAASVGKSPTLRTVLAMETPLDGAKHRRRPRHGPSGSPFTGAMVCKRFWASKPTRNPYGSHTDPVRKAYEGRTENRTKVAQNVREFRHEN